MRWYRAKGDASASLIRGICDALRQDQELRRLRYVEGIQRYENLAVYDATASDMNKAVQGEDTYNLTRSLIDTVQADIAARQRPKPSFLTSSAEWKLRRRAKKLDDFVEAQMFEDQGAYEDVWQVFLDCFIDACMPGFGTGVAKVWADKTLKKIRTERVLPYEILFDPEEWKYRNGQNLFHTYTMSRDMLIDSYCPNCCDDDDSDGGDEEERAIHYAINAAECDDKARVTMAGHKIADMVRVYEAWRLPFGDRPGKHIICIGGKVLLEEEWKLKKFPFVFMQWARERIGPWGHGLGDEVAPLHTRVNDTSLRLSERMEKCSNSFYFVPVGSKVDKEKLSSNDDGAIIEYVGQQPPVMQPAQPASSQEFQWVEDNIRRAYDFPGVSQMSANSRKESGITAAVALREMNDIQTVRFLPKARVYEQAFASWGELAVACAAELGDSLMARWPGKGFLKTIKWSDVKLDEDMYTVRVVAASQLSRDIGTRYQMAQEMFDGGLITPEQFKSLLGMPDLDAILERDTAELDYVEMILDRYLDCESRAKLQEMGGYAVPDPAIGDKPSALNLVRQTYFEALRDGAPEFSLMLIRRYMTELVDAIAPPPQPGLPAAAGPLPPPGEAPVPLPGDPMAGGPPMPMPTGAPAGMPIQ